MGVRRLRAQGDSKLIIKHVNREFAFKEISLLSYQTVIQRLIKSFKYIQIDHVLREHNRHMDTLASLHQRLTFQEADEHHQKDPTNHNNVQNPYRYHR